jgi:hypothetical protein
MGYWKETHYGIDYRIVGSLTVGQRYIKEAHQFYNRLASFKQGEPVWFGMRHSGTAEHPITIRVQNIEGTPRITVFAEEVGGVKHMPDRPRPRSVIESETYVPYIVTYELTGRDEWGYLMGHCNGMLLCSETFDTPVQWIERFDSDRTMEELEREARDFIAASKTEDPMPGSLIIDLRNMGVNPVETSVGRDTLTTSQFGRGIGAVYSSSCSSQLQTPLGEPLSETASLSQTVVNTLERYSAPYPMSCMKNNYFQSFSRSGSAYHCGMGQACFYDSEHYGMLYQFSNESQAFLGCIEGNDATYKGDYVMRWQTGLSGWPDCVPDLWWLTCNYHPEPERPDLSPLCSEPYPPHVCNCETMSTMDFSVNNYAYVEEPINFRWDGGCLYDFEQAHRAMPQGDGFHDGLPWHHRAHILSIWPPSFGGYVALNVNGDEIVLWEGDLGYETMGFHLGGHTNRSTVRNPAGEPTFGFVDTQSGDGSPVFGAPYEDGEARLNRKPRDYDSAGHPVNEYRGLANGESGLSTMKYYYLSPNRQIFIYSFFVRDFPKTLDPCYETVFYPELDAQCFNHWRFGESYAHQQECAGGCGYDYPECSGPLFAREGGHPFQVYHSVMLCQGARFYYGIYYAGDGWPEDLQGNHLTVVDTTPTDIWESRAEMQGHVICHDIGLAKRVSVSDVELKSHPLNYTEEKAVEGEPL